MAINTDDFDWFEPTKHIEVGIPKGVQIQVTFSHFSIPKEYLPAGFRGIADIDFNPKDPNAVVVVRVRVLHHEQEKNIFALKNGEWTILENQSFEADRQGIWAGYLQAEIIAGDPPVAVG